MKVAIAYDWLNVKEGGGEATLLEVTKLYPNADIFCLIYNRKKFGKYYDGRTVTTSRLQRFPGFIKKRPALLLPFIEKAVDRLDFTGYDLVISVSSAWVKNITVPEKTTHISYCFSPARMLWDSWPQYLDTQKIGPFKLGHVGRFMVTRQVSKLRLWDYYNAQNVDAYIAISQYISKRIRKYYGRDSLVVYPPVNTDAFANTLPVKQEYYLVLSVLSRYKNIDLVVEAFKKNKLELIIAGDGPDRERLEELVGGAKNITFEGRVSDERKLELTAGAKAFVFPSIEDFGITPIEAMAAGTPVIALRGGGLEETVTSKTGLFFDTPTVASLNRALKEFAKHKFDVDELQKSASKYCVDVFSQEFPVVVEKLMREDKHGKK